MTPASRHSSARQTYAALLSTASGIVLVLTLGALAFSPLGEQALHVGVSAGFACVIVGGLCYALGSGLALPLGGPSSATALVLAGLVNQLVRDPAIHLAGAEGLAAVLALSAGAVLMMGLLQMLMGLSGLGRLAQYVPQPVLAGFMNGVAILILVSQLPPLLGLPPKVHVGDAGVLALVQPLTLAVGVSTALLTWFVARRWPRLPAPLLGLLGGSLLHAALLAALSDPALLAAMPDVALGPRMGALPHDAPWPVKLLPLLDAPVQALLQRHAGALLATAAVLALVGALETLLAAVVVDQLTHTRHSGRRELLAVGAANIACACWGGLPVVLSRARAIAAFDAGGRHRSAAWLAVPLFAALWLWGGPLLALLPRTVLAGLMVVVAFALVDRWTRQLLRQWRDGDHSPELRTGLVLVAVVAAVTVGLGFVAAVALGVLLSAGIFVRRMNRSLLRERSSGEMRPSRRIYAPAQEALLAGLRRRITVLELEGALFFGTAERLASMAETLPADCRVLVLDFRRVSSIDETGAVLLQSLQQRLALRGVALRLAGVTPEHAHGRRLRACGCFRNSEETDWWPDTDRAMEAAEALLLAEAGAASTQATVPLEHTALLHGLAPAQAAAVARCLQPQHLPAGALLFSRGDPGDRLYVLTEGSVSIVGSAGGQRYVSYSPGAMFGEAAMLDGAGRSASAVADSDAVVHALSAAALDELARQDPALALVLMRHVALHLSQRLRGADWAWRAAAG
jgi:SulP family sulfate permease